MVSDEHGMPVPDDESPLPWRLCGPFEIMASNEIYVAELGESLGDIDVEFIVHAANWIIPCREIVRKASELFQANDASIERAFYLSREAAKLWAEMRREAKGGDGG